MEGKIQVYVEGSRHNSSGLLRGEGRAQLVSTGSRWLQAEKAAETWPLALPTQEQKVWLQGQPQVSKSGRGTWRGLKVVALDHEVPRSPDPLNWEAEGKWSLGPSKEPVERETSGARPWSRDWPRPTQKSRVEGHLFHPKLLPQHMHTFSLNSPETEITPSHPPEDGSGRRPGCASVLGEA